MLSVRFSDMSGAGIDQIRCLLSQETTETKENYSLLGTNMDITGSDFGKSASSCDTAGNSSFK